MEKQEIHHGLIEVRGIVVKTIRGRRYALRACSDNRVARGIPMPNFMNTGLALVGILQNNETIYQFAGRINELIPAMWKDTVRLEAIYKAEKQKSLLL